MSIVRPTITDDDGTRTTGTIFNAAFWSDIFDRIDAFVALYLPLTGGTLTGGLVATKFKTASGSTGSIATATPTTIFSVASGGVASLYHVSAVVNSSGSAANYTAFATVVFDGTDPRIVSSNGGALTITLSGNNVQVTQTSGSNQTINWLYTKHGA